MENRKKARTNALWILGATWYVIINIFIATYIRLNYLPEAYETAYWTAVCVYCFGAYCAVAYFCIMGGFSDE